MEKILKITIYIILVCSMLTAASFYFATDFYNYMVAEDGPFENLTAIVLLAISVLFLVRFIKTRKTHNVYWVILNVLIIMGTFFGFGEEISWGQRIFSIEAGDFFTQNNLQNETNLHNLEIGGVKLNKLIFSQGLVIVFGFYFVLSLLLYRKVLWFNKLIDLFGVQLPRFRDTAIMLVCTSFITIVPDLKIWELWEAVFVSILLLVFVDPWNKREKLLV